MAVVELADEKRTLHEYLRGCRADLLSKLDGLGEYDLRRPLTPTGTNLLGILKHLIGVEVGYFGATFGRPAGRALPWLAEGAEDAADMWATAEQTSQEIIELYRYAAAHADARIRALPLGAAGEVPGWPPQRRRVSLHQILTHVCVETARHAGHADILRELIDNTAGRRPGDPSLPALSAEQWAAYRDRIQAAAQQASPARTEAATSQAATKDPRREA